VKKEQKHYHLDWSLVPSEPARFENLVAAHLLKWGALRAGRAGPRPGAALFPGHGRTGVDFVVVEARRPLLLVEAKWGDAEADKSSATSRPAFPRPTPGRCRPSAEGLPDARGHPRRPALELLSTLV